MNPKDPLIHEQLVHLVTQGRKAVVADVAILIVKGKDPEVGASVTMLVSDTRYPSDNESHELAVVIDALFKGIDNLLKATGKDMKLVLRDTKTGKDFDVNENAFGHTVVKMEVEDWEHIVKGIGG